MNKAMMCLVGRVSFLYLATTNKSTVFLIHLEFQKGMSIGTTVTRPVIPSLVLSQIQMNNATMNLVGRVSFVSTRINGHQREPPIPLLPTTRCVPQNRLRFHRRTFSNCTAGLYLWRISSAPPLAKDFPEIVL